MANCFGFWTSNWAANLAIPIITPEINLRKRILLFIDILLIIWFHFIIVFVIRIHYFEMISCSKSHCYKHHLALILLDLFLLMTWYSLILKRTPLKKLLKEYHDFENSFGHDNLKKLRGILNGTTFGYIFFGLVLITIMLIYFTTDDILVRNWYKSFNIFETHFQLQRVLLFIYVVSSRVFFKFLPGVIVLLFLSLFSSLILGLCRCEKEMARIKSKKFVRRFIDMYSVVNRLAVSAETALSLTIFFLNCYYFTSVYIMISNFYHRAEANDVIFETDKMLRDIVLPLLFEIMFTVATEVHNRDVELRKKLMDKLFEVNPTALASLDSDYLSKFINSKPVITITAFKMFSLTRTFILTSMGMMLTYSLLILQLTPPDER